ncbi:hypothetical protein ACFYT7_26945 [Streptomyces sp. NPDC004041]|uniref:hypothetical protein n=1 Tax=unclassified Streptomyces TaxID=2593676 RepID=UPI0036784D50
MSQQPSTHEYHNEAGSQIGAQGSTIYGGVHFGPPPAAYAAMDRGQQIEALRGALAQARTAGEIDGETYDDASGALDEAMQHAEASDETSRNAFVRSLRKVKGLVDEVGGLVTAVAAIIAAVAGT